MYFVIVTIHVKPERAEDFRVAIVANATGTRREPGNLRFDVVRGEDDPNRFMLYEVYREKADFLAHQTQPHYIKWRDAAEEMVERPRTSLKHVPVFYGDGETT